MTKSILETTDDGCCGGGVGPIPYPGCTDCPRALTGQQVTRQETKPMTYEEAFAHGARAYKENRPFPCDGLPSDLQKATEDGWIDAEDRGDG